jgi:dimethylglycine dehydrogenase
VVIGGGVVGCSVLYHLTKLGWSDVMLVERSELTSGSTWHAAGGFHTLNGDTNMAALQGYTIRLYRELEEITGMSCGLHHVGGITLADTPERWDMLKAERAKHRHMGLDTHLVTPSEVAEMTDGLVNVEGASWARSTTRSTGISTPRAPPTPMRGRRRWGAPRSSRTPACSRRTRAPTAPGTW